MVSIYTEMKRDWKIYCLISGIALIEEMTKPTVHIQIKKRKEKEYKCHCFRTIRLKIKNKDIIDKWWNITRYWERKKNMKLMGFSFKNGPKIEKYSSQYYINFSPTWLYEIVKTIGSLPSKYTFNIVKQRIMKMSEPKPNSVYVSSKKEILSFLGKYNLYNSLYSNKFLAAGAFVVSFDLEFKGVLSASPCLCMTTKYQDFLEFMLSISKAWRWTNNTKLFDVDIKHSLKRGINANSKKEFRLSINGMKDIYKLAGPLADIEKDKFIKFHIKRSNNPLKPIRGRSKKKIINILKTNGPTKTTLLQIPIGVRTDVILKHLKDLENQNLVKKERRGKYFLWSYMGD
ncbi:MAG: hypothetical protein J7K26_04140 [Candidatus Aenigmarchaeota archaeon]|nr:hypothetical protein [Candidatus Aenigmarchaeota archaeon]